MGSSLIPVRLRNSFLASGDFLSFSTNLCNLQFCLDLGYLIVFLYDFLENVNFEKSTNVIKCMTRYPARKDLISK